MDDLLCLDDLLKDDEKLIRESVRHFVNQDVLPIINDAFERASFPIAFIKQAAELGLFGMTLPEEWGGINASPVAYGLACQELEKGDSALRSLISVQSSLCMYPIFRFGSDDQKKRWLKEMALGNVLGCFGLTEPHSGSDPGSMRTTAKKVPGGFRLNGSKMWITNATLAHLAIVFAKTTEGIQGFLVEKDFEGFTSQEIHQKMSLRASVTGELIFQDVFVPDANCLPDARGLKAALSCLNQARYGIAWGAIGAAEACFDMTNAYLKERQQFGKPLASFQLIQKELAHMYAEILKAQCLNLQVGRLKESDSASPPMISLIKSNACREALHIARACRNLLGANGITLDYHVIRHLLNLESVFTYEGTDHIHTLILGQHITGLNAFG